MAGIEVCINAELIAIILRPVERVAGVGKTQCRVGGGKRQAPQELIDILQDPHWQETAFPDQSEVFQIESCHDLWMRNIPSTAIAKMGGTSGVYRSEWEAVGFVETSVRSDYLTVQARENVIQSHALSADEASKQRVMSHAARLYR